MLTLKFGGTSMGNAERIIGSCEIMCGRSKKDRISVVVSAVAGISNALQAAIDVCSAGGDFSEHVARMRTTHTEICNNLEKSVKGFDSKKVLAAIEERLCELEKLLGAVSAFQECPTSIYCRIMGMGELMCVPMVAEVLRAKGEDVEVLDSREYLFTTGRQEEGEPDYSATEIALAAYKDGSKDEKSKRHVLLFPGFVCGWKNPSKGGVSMGLFGRNGSDFSAAIVGASLDSEKVEFWTDVDGIYTADPRIVPDAVLVDDMTYGEAMELSFFGSKVLHPKTLAPLEAKNIEAWSMNSHNPSARGTRIGKGPFESEKKVGPVCGISSLHNVALISVGGAGMKGTTGIASRIFNAVSKAGISMLLISQSSSEYTISFCVRQWEAEATVKALDDEFKFEIRDKVINPVEVKDEVAIVSIVGDRMKETRGVAGKFFESLASRDINILAIAQSSNERSISAVVNGEDGKLAIRTAHMFFFNTAQSIEVFAFGCGTIGGALIDQIKVQHDNLASQNINIKVVAIANGHQMILNENGIDLSTWREELKKSEDKNDLSKIFEFVKVNRPMNPIFVDCTASYDLPEKYIEILNAGMHIATPNKRANSMSMEYYKALRATANKMHRRFLYETNVGAGLPIIDTLQTLFSTGDKLTGFNGIMSGSLSYIFGKLDEGLSFSKAVLEAKDLKFTEPDPRDDLGGLDVARKALIVARESGMSLELDDIEMRSIFPADFNTEGTTEEFLKRLPEVDKYFADKMAQLKKENKVLRMGASIKDGKVSVGILEVGATDPLYGVKGGENAFVFQTARYSPIPLTVRGYGAGAEVTAAGVFGDILRTVSFNPEN